MSTQPTSILADTGQRKIIVAPNLEGNGISLGKFLVVWATSTAINVMMLVLAFFVFLFLGKVIAGEAVAEPEVTQTTEVEDREKDPDLTSDSIGDDSSLPPGFDLERIDEVANPGRVDPTAPVGIPGAPELAPRSVPPPPGSNGISGAILDPNVAGTASMTGPGGGMNGLYNMNQYGGRSGATKVRMLQEGGGNARSEASVASGLKFLALHQAGDGHWSLHDFNRHARTAPLPAGKVQPDNTQTNTTQANNTAGTAFGLLPFLAAGITHKPPKNKPQIDYSKGVGLAIRYLIAKQTKSGNDCGYYGEGMYSHGLATIAMCEAYGLTSDPQIKASAQLALNYIVSAQDVSGGGWRYAARQAGDTSVTGWQLMALKSGQMAGLLVPRITLNKVSKFLDSCESSSKGGYGYVPGGGETVTMTAVAGLCRQYLGVNPRNPSLLASVKRIKASPPGASGNIYYEYYATQVMHHMGGEAWQFWNLGPDGTGKGGIRDTMIAKQDGGTGGRPGQTGSWAGSAHVGGRLGATSLSLLSLEVYYRHLPLYRRDMGVVKDK